MKPLAWVGAVLLVLGILAFLVPVPHSESHGVKVGDESVGITTTSNQKMSPIVGGALCGVGALVLIFGLKK